MLLACKDGLPSKATHRSIEASSLNAYDRKMLCPITASSAVDVAGSRARSRSFMMR